MLTSLVLLLGACTTGEGWVRGKLWVENCDSGKALGDSPGQQADYDLGAGFFAAETLEDSNASVNQRRNGLTFRIQDTSNWLEDANGIVFQVLDLRAAARLFARGDPIPVTYRAPLAEAGKSSVDDLVRARLYLYTMCPHCKVPKVGSSRQLALSPAGSGTSTASSGPDCFVPATKELPACPTLTSAQKQSLQAMCQGDFSDQSSRAQVRSLLGAPSSCLYLCEIGSAQRGQDPATLDKFLIEYGDRLAGFFSLEIRDARALKLGSCSKVMGEMQGMFSFEVARNRVAQSFP